MEWSDGAKFHGVFKDGRIVKGQYTFASGSLYDG